VRPNPDWGYNVLLTRLVAQASIMFNAGMGSFKAHFLCTLGATKKHLSGETGLKIILFKNAKILKSIYIFNFIMYLFILVMWMVNDFDADVFDHISDRKGRRFSSVARIFYDNKFHMLRISKLSPHRTETKLRLIVDKFRK